MCGTPVDNEFDGADDESVWEGSEHFLDVCRVWEGACVWAICRSKISKAFSLGGTFEKVGGTYTAFSYTVYPTPEHRGQNMVTALFSSGTARYAN